MALRVPARFAAERRPHGGRGFRPWLYHPAPLDRGAIHDEGHRVPRAFVVRC